MSDVIDIDDSAFEEMVERSLKPTLVMFHSPSCPHCKRMMPHFEKYASEFKGNVTFARVNVLENNYTTQRYGIMGTPTFKFFCKSRPVHELVGAANPKHLKRLVEEGLRQGDECKKT